MSHPLTARSGIVWAGGAMFLAIVVTFFMPGMRNLPLMAIAMIIGGGLGWFAAKKVAMTDMPQMVAIYNGMGGGSAGAIAAVELLGSTSNPSLAALSVAGAMIGGISIAGAMECWHNVHVSVP